MWLYSPGYVRVATTWDGAYTITWGKGHDLPPHVVTKIANQARVGAGLLTHPYSDAVPYLEC